jgi:hypothetical protein
MSFIAKSRSDCRIQTRDTSAELDQHRQELQFEVGDLVLAHLRKERFPRGTYKKLKMKKIGPCRAMKKFGENAYEIELPNGIGILLDIQHLRFEPLQN